MKCKRKGCNKEVFSFQYKFCGDCESYKERQEVLKVGERIQRALSELRGVRLSLEDLRLLLKDGFAASFIDQMKMGPWKEKIYGRNRSENDRQQECRIDGSTALA